jgi:hypothetical protein
MAIIEQDYLSPKYQIPLIVEWAIKPYYSAKKSLSDFDVELEGIYYANTGKYVGNLVYKYLEDKVKFDLNINDVESYL